MGTFRVGAMRRTPHSVWILAGHVAVIEAAGADSDASTTRESSSAPEILTLDALDCNLQRGRAAQHLKPGSLTENHLPRSPDAPCLESRASVPWLGLLGHGLPEPASGAVSRETAP